MAPTSRAYDANEWPPRGAAEATARDAALAELASRQHGVVSVRQLLELGLTRDAIRRRAQARRLTRLHRGVYAVGHWALTPASRDLAAVLACGPQALLSHRAAGARLGLVKRGNGAIDVTAPRGCKPKPAIALHNTRAIHPADRTTVDSIPTTSVARTIVDLASVLDDRRLAAVVNEAEVLRVFDLGSIEATVKRLHGRRGTRRLEGVLAAYTDPPGYSTSEAERILLSLCKQHGLPQPSRVFMHGFELDFYWADARVAIEVDGRAVHTTSRAFQADRARDRVLAGNGIQTVRVTWADLTTAPKALAAELHDIRRQRLA